MAKRRGNNEGGITKRKDGRFQGYVNVGYDPVTGKTKKQYFYSRDRQEIQDKMRETLYSAYSGTSGRRHRRHPDSKPGYPDTLSMDLICSSGFPKAVDL
jgi:hypothetical protein